MAVSHLKNIPGPRIYVYNSFFYFKLKITKRKQPYGVSPPSILIPKYNIKQDKNPQHLIFALAI